MGSSQKRSDEMILVGYFLSRCTDFSDAKTPRPPSALGVDSWNSAYDLFFDLLSEGRASQQFRHTLKNTRDIFDSLFENGRKGWSDGQKRGAELSERDRAVHTDWSSQSDENLAKHILGMIAIKAISKPNDGSNNISFSDSPNRVIGSFSPVYEVAPNSSEADWSPPSDLPSQHDIRLVQAADNRRLLDQQKASFAIMDTPVSELTHKPKITKKDERRMDNDRITSTLEGIIADLEGQISHLNAEGAKLFRLSEYEKATKIAEFGRKLKTFRDKVSGLGSDYQEVLDTIPIFTEPETRKAIEHQPAKRRKSPRKRLSATMHDGRIISEKTAADTFTKVILELGIEKVKELALEVNNVPLVSDTQSERYTTAHIDGQYLMTHTNTSHKKELLTRIAEALGAEMTVEVSD
jgi:5-methylcytosine-specific restriction protein A